jgi:hypothetical protein
MRSSILSFTDPVTSPSARWATTASGSDSANAASAGASASTAPGTRRMWSSDAATMAILRRYLPGGSAATADTIPA